MPADGSHDDLAAFGEEDFLNADDWSRFDMWSGRAYDMVRAAVGAMDRDKPDPEVLLRAAGICRDLAEAAVPGEWDPPGRLDTE